MCSSIRCEYSNRKKFSLSYLTRELSINGKISLTTLAPSRLSEIDLVWTRPQPRLWITFGFRWIAKGWKKNSKFYFIKNFANLTFECDFKLSQLLSSKLLHKSKVQFCNLNNITDWNNRHLSDMQNCIFAIFFSPASNNHRYVKFSL